MGVSMWAHRLGMWASRRYITGTYSSAFYAEFKSRSRNHIEHIVPATPDIGPSVFRLNFQFTPAYIAWYKALRDMAVEQDENIRILWAINERIFGLVPKRLMRRYGGKIYLGGFRKKAAEHERRCKENAIHAYDYEIRFRNIDANTFEIDIFTCGMRKLAHDFDADGLFPGICRIDYLISNRMGCGFYRNKTLGDGDAVCNCGYQIKGQCEWAHEKGFLDRK